MVLQAMVLAITVGRDARDRGGFCHLLDKGKQPKPMENMHMITYLVLENVSNNHILVSSPLLWIIMQRMKV